MCTAAGFYIIIFLQFVRYFEDSNICVKKIHGNIKTFVERLIRTATLDPTGNRKLRTCEYENKSQVKDEK